MYKATPLPQEIATREVRIVRPRDAAHIYRNPPLEFKRLTAAGRLVKVARGYYAVPPSELLGVRGWRPSPEAIALGIALADYPVDRVALSGVSAARLQGIPPRALAVGIVTVPKARSTITSIAGPIHFWTRNVFDLDIQRARTELATGWSTTLEQTVLDIAERPDLGGVSVTTSTEALWELATRVDWSLIVELTNEQRRWAALLRARWVTAGLTEGLPMPPVRSQRRISSRGLRSWSDADRYSYGIADD